MHRSLPQTPARLHTCSKTWCDLPTCSFTKNCSGQAERRTETDHTLFALLYPHHDKNLLVAQVGQGTDLSSRYAVIVSFGVLLNGTALDEIAARVGVNGSSEAVLDTLVR